MQSKVLFELKFSTLPLSLSDHNQRLIIPQVDFLLPSRAVLVNGRVLMGAQVLERKRGARKFLGKIFKR